MKKSLANHIARLHSTEQVDCPTCGQVFTSNLAMKSHMKRTHAEKTFLCDFEGCTQRYSENYRLQLHIKYTHLGIKEHECQICNKLFNSRDKLKRHMLQVHSAVKYSCEVRKCNTQWPTREAYKNHVIKRHQDFGEEFIQDLLDRITSMDVPIVKKNIEFLECFEISEVGVGGVTEIQEIPEITEITEAEISEMGEVSEMAEEDIEMEEEVIE